VAVESALHPEIQGKSHSRRDGRIAALAAQQHGVVSRAQLLTFGLGHSAIDDRLARGLLHPIHRGVFSVGHRVLTREGAWIAAVLAAGPGAVLSHRSAAALWGIRDASRAAIEVITTRCCRRAGIHSHRVTLPADETTTERGIPVTTVTRTLLDLAEVLTSPQLERAVTEAEVRRLGSPHSLDALVARHPRRRGTVALKRILQNRGDIARHVTRSELEAAFLTFLDAHGLARPTTNACVAHGTGTYEVDAVWPAHRLIVELDGYAVHTTRRSFENDRARDRVLTADGWRVVRITRRQLDGPGHELATQLRRLLAHVR
jgi:very-short-patch-repair endonuclease